MISAVICMDRLRQSDYFPKVPNIEFCPLCICLRSIRPILLQTEKTRMTVKWHSSHWVSNYGGLRSSDPLSIHLSTLVLYSSNMHRTKYNTSVPVCKCTTTVGNCCRIMLNGYYYMCHILSCCVLVISFFPSELYISKCIGCFSGLML